ncbi:hypothetical protein HKX48_000090 [Thoreauomyces humboldtii]|nr:hypothetical protein HKX48_000090 [Thoreauomyces humboldtii]
MIFTQAALFFAAATLAAAPFVTARPRPSDIIIRDQQTLVTVCDPPTSDELAGTWLNTTFGQSADAVLLNTASVYNRQVLQNVHNCLSLDGNVSVALTEFYIAYWSAELVLHDTPADSTDVFARSNLLDTVCDAIESVQTLLVTVTEAQFSDGVCLDATPAPAADTQIVNFNCDYPGYQPADRPYLTPELDTSDDPKVTYLAVGYGCRGNLVKRMARRDQRMMEISAGRKA